MTASPPPLPVEPPIAARRRADALPPLDFQLLSELPSLELQARYLVDGFLSGRHRSPQKGSSVEFAEYRAYQLGDDLRRIDWRLYGRTDRLHLKQYEEETQLRVFFVLDASASMHYQSRPQVMSKIVCARLVAAALALLAQRQGDAFGYAHAGEELQDFLRARSSASHWRAFIGRLEALRPGGHASLGNSLEELAELIPARSVVVIASDFYEDLPGLEAALRRLRYDRHDLIGLHVLDPVECDFDLEDSGTFVDIEHGFLLPLDAAAVRQGYLERFGAFCRELEDLFRAAGGDLVRFRADRAPMEALAQYLALRGRRRR